MIAKVLGRLRSGHSGNIAWSLAGFVVPLAVGLVFIPLIIRQMGVELFGVLSIIWMLIGYFTLFDLGISRALTYLLSRNIGAGEVERNQLVYSTALPVVGIMGLLGGVLFWSCSEVLATRVFNVDAALIPAVRDAFRWTAIAIPFTIWATVMRSCLESYAEFRLINLVKIPINAWFLVGPYAFYLFSDSFSLAVLSLLLARIAMFVAYLLANQRHLRFSVGAIQPALLKELFAFGGWMTVSNVVSPIMVYFDRFLIGSFLSVTLVGYYSAPYEIVTKVLVVPIAIASVLFPAVSKALSERNVEEVRSLIKRFGMLIAGLVGVVTLCLISAGGWGLEWWLGPEFREQGYWVLFWISLGVLFNSLAQVPFCVIQASGASKVTALIHLAEVPLYLVALSVALVWYQSISAVAFVWCLRVLVDLLVLTWVSGRLVDAKAR